MDCRARSACPRAARFPSASRALSSGTARSRGTNAAPGPLRPWPTFVSSETGLASWSRRASIRTTTRRQLGSNRGRRLRQRWPMPVGGKQRIFRSVRCSRHGWPTAYCATTATPSSSEHLREMSCPSLATSRSVSWMTTICASSCAVSAANAALGALRSACSASCASSTAGAQTVANSHS